MIWFSELPFNNSWNIAVFNKELRSMWTRWDELLYTKEEENKQQHKENTFPWGRPEAGLLKQRLWTICLKMLNSEKNELRGNRKTRFLHIDYQWSDGNYEKGLHKCSDYKAK